MKQATCLWYNTELLLAKMTTTTPFGPILVADLANMYRLKYV
jgi:hypothetical protein